MDFISLHFVHKIVIMSNNDNTFTIIFKASNTLPTTNVWFRCSFVINNEKTKLLLFEVIIKKVKWITATKVNRGPILDGALQFYPAGNGKTYPSKGYGWRCWVCAWSIQVQTFYTFFLFVCRSIDEAFKRTEHSGYFVYSWVLMEVERYL